MIIPSKESRVKAFLIEKLEKEFFGGKREK
jgi:hypothetical protein